MQFRFFAWSQARFEVNEKRYIEAFTNMTPHRIIWKVPGVEAPPPLLDDLRVFFWTGKKNAERCEKEWSVRLPTGGWGRGKV